MLNNMTIERIHVFWNWFQSNLKEIILLANGTNRSLELDIGSHLKQIDPGLGWEIGPGRKQKYGIAVSPNGTRDLLKIVDCVVEHAPTIPDWEVVGCKPPKMWDFRIQFRNRRGQEIALDANDWKYSMISYGKGEFYDITLVAPNLPPMDIKARGYAAYAILDSILGERTVIERVGKVKLISASELTDTRFDKTLSALQVLAKHLSFLQTHPE